MYLHTHRIDRANKISGQRSSSIALHTIVVAATFTLALYGESLRLMEPEKGADPNACARSSDRASRAEHAAYLSSDRALHGEAVQMAARPFGVRWFAVHAGGVSQRA
jgi:hypothetical protein